MSTETLTHRSPQQITEELVEEVNPTQKEKKKKRHKKTNSTSEQRLRTTTLRWERTIVSEKGKERVGRLSLQPKKIGGGLLGACGIA